MEPARIRDVFLKRRNFEQDIKLVPVNPLGEEGMRRTFEEECKANPQDRQLVRACEWLRKNIAMKDAAPDGAPEDF